jgi:hypothetical protein
MTFDLTCPHCRQVMSGKALVRASGERPEPGDRVVCYRCKRTPVVVHEVSGGLVKFTRPVLRAETEVEHAESLANPQLVREVLAAIERDLPYVAAQFDKAFPGGGS